MAHVVASIELGAAHFRQNIADLLPNGRIYPTTTLTTGKRAFGPIFKGVFGQVWAVISSGQADRASGYALSRTAKAPPASPSALAASTSRAAAAMPSGVNPTIS